MQNSPPIFLLISLTIGLLGAFVTFMGTRMHASNMSRRISISATLPALVTLTLFYSLAIHMRQSLGAWPAAIGTQGFSSSLLTHAEIATNFFGILLVGGVFAWPIACLASAMNPRWRGWLPYLGIFALSCFVCFLAMSLAPSEFLGWWWD